MTGGQKLLTAYLPYTLAAVGLVFFLISTSKSWLAVLSGGVIFVGWSLGLAFCQLVIFFLPTRPCGTGRFHVACILVTLVNLLLAPFLVGLAVWIIGQAMRLAA